MRGLVPMALPGAGRDAVTLLLLLLVSVVLASPPRELSPAPKHSHTLSSFIASCFPPNAFLLVTDVQTPYGQMEEDVIAELLRLTASNNFTVVTMASERAAAAAEYSPVGKQAVPVAGFVTVGPARNVTDSLTLLTERALWSAGARFFVLLTDACGRRAAERLLAAMWSSSVADVLVAMPCPSLHSVHLYASFPFRSATRRCGRTDLGVELVAKLQPGGPQGCAPFYPPKLPRDLQGCVVRASITPGTQAPRCSPSNAQATRKVSEKYFISTNVFLAAAQHSNFTAQVSEEVFAEVAAVFDNGTATGRLALLQRGEADVALDFFRMTGASFRVLRPSFTLLQDRSRIHVHCDRGWVWSAVRRKAAALVVMLVAMVALMSALLLLFSRLQGERFALIEVATSVWAVLTEAPTTNFGPTTSVRVLFSSFILFTVSFNVAVKGRMTSEATRSDTVSHITSFERLRESGVVVGYTNPVEGNVLSGVGLDASRTVLCGNDCGRQFEAREDFALMNLDRFPTSLHCTESCSYVIPMPVQLAHYVFYYRKKFPLADHLDRAIHILHQAGFMIHWHRMIANDEARAPDQRKSDLYNWRIAYTVLLAGLALSSCVFVGEILSKPKQNKSDMC